MLWIMGLSDFIGMLGFFVFMKGFYRFNNW